MDTVGASLTVNWIWMGNSECFVICSLKWKKLCWMEKKRQRWKNYSVTRSGSTFWRSGIGRWWKGQQGRGKRWGRAQQRDLIMASMYMYYNHFITMIFVQTFNSRTTQCLTYVHVFSNYILHYNLSCILNYF